jgi:hypothetical protein
MVLHGARTSQRSSSGRPESAGATYEPLRFDPEARRYLVVGIPPPARRTILARSAKACAHETQALRIRLPSLAQHQRFESATQPNLQHNAGYAHSMPGVSHVAVTKPLS